MNSSNSPNSKDVKLRADEILASFDATALFPSIPLQKCIEVIKQLLLNDPTLSSRTSLTPDDIISLIQLCLSTSDFIYDGVHHTASDSGPIGLSLMVVVAEIWMDHTINEAVKIAEQKNIAIPRKLSLLSLL